MTFEELKKEFKSRDFRIEGDRFISEFEDRNVEINGRHPVRRFEMMYIGEGSVCTAGDSDETPLYQFDVIGQTGEPAFTICIEDFDDFVNLVNL